MTLQPLEKLVHPLERLIQRYGQNRTRADIGRKMAEISFSLEAGTQKNCLELEYKKEFKARAKYYEGYLSKYLAGSSKPEIEMLLLMSRAIDCDLEELAEIFYPNYYAFSANHDAQGNNPIKLLELPTQENIPTDAEEINQLPELDYKLLQVNIKATYVKGNPNTLRWSKTFRLKSLKNYLKVLEKFDYYKCVRDKPDVDISYSGEPLKIRREQALDSDDNVVSIIFDTPLEQGQEVEFTLNYFCSEVIDRDIEFHYTWILQPIDLLRLEVVPPEPENNRQAKYHVHINKGCPWGIEQITESADVFLDAESGSYKLELPNPRLYATYGFYWGRKYW